MPYYDYKCENCGNEFEELHSIDDRHKPEEELCHVPTCMGKVKMKIAFPGLADPIRLGLRKPDDGFKDMMRRMKKNVAGAQDMPLRF